jgi:hypothetical protein
MYDKEVITPRLNAWYGDLGTDYSAAGKVSNPMPCSIIEHLDL